MASLRKSRGEDGGVVLCFRFAGKQYNRNLGTVSTKEAEARRKRVEAFIHDLETGRDAVPEGCQDVGTFILSGGKLTAKPILPALLTVQDVVDGFLAVVEARVSPECFKQYQKHLWRFAKEYGRRVAESLTPEEAEDYSRKPEWSPSYRNGVLGTLVSAFKWAAKKSLITKNPLAGVKKPRKASRGRTALISLEQYAALCEHADPFMRAFLGLLWYTGARPSEVAKLTAANVDLDNGVAILTEHKTADQTEKDRVIFLTPEAAAILQERKKLHSQGLLFPGEDGGRLTAQALGCRLRRLCIKTGVPHCILYGFRHSYATQALLKRVPDSTVAALLGHCDTSQLHRHYSHLTAHAQALRQEAVKVRAG